MTTYKEAGVDIDAGNELVKRIKMLNSSIGGFNGIFPFGEYYLVAGTDGVGTKLKLAFELNEHSTIGIDLVAMCVNDLIPSGADPLFFLDYYATSKLDVEQAEVVIKGITKGCNIAGCTLLGGETAEMPDFYREGEYDLSGFAVGSVLKEKLIDGSTIRAGDIVIGLSSSGVHSNGFSLIRKIIQNEGAPLEIKLELMRPTEIYVDRIKKIKDTFSIKGMAHITGGGLVENIPRVLPNGLGVTINKDNWEIPSIFQWIKQTGNVPEEEMWKTFNMGIGYVLIIDASIREHFLIETENAYEIGTVVEREGVQLL